MDNIYAFGINCIVLLQKKFSSYEDFFMLVNKLADPNRTLIFLFPILSVFDSVFASELHLITVFGGWLNCVLKWILSEHRPFWWIRETHFYGPIHSNKPILHLNSQTCETGPGSPSGHSMFAASLLTLICSWITINSRINNKKWLKGLLWFVSGAGLIIVTMSRLFIAAHFPHQCLLGVIFGFLVGHFIPAYWLEPFLSIEEDNNETVNDKESQKNENYIKRIRRYMATHVTLVVFMIISAFGLYWGQKLIGVDPSWSVKLAFKWCPSPEFMHFNTTPFYTLVQTTGAMLGWSLCTTPSIKKYRYNSKGRSIFVAALCSLVFQQIFQQWQDSISRDDAVYFYLLNFFAFALQPFFFLRLVPLISCMGQKINKQPTSVERKKNQ